MAAWGREIWSSPQAAFVWILVRAGEKIPSSLKGYSNERARGGRKAFLLSPVGNTQPGRNSQDFKALSQTSDNLLQMTLSCRQDHLNTTKQPEEWDEITDLRSWNFFSTMSSNCTTQRKLVSPPRSDPSFEVHQLAPCLCLTLLKYWDSEQSETADTKMASAGWSSTLPSLIRNEAFDPGLP